MKTLRLLTLSILLVTFSATTIFAQNGGGECNPGNTQSPPCAAAQSLPPDQESFGEAAGLATTQTASTTDVLAELTFGLVEAVLAIF